MDIDDYLESDDILESAYHLSECQGRSDGFIEFEYRGEYYCQHAVDMVGGMVSGEYTGEILIYADTTRH